MSRIKVLILLILSPTYPCQIVANLFKNINENVIKLNAKAADITWESSINPGNPDLPRQSAEYLKERIKWEQRMCGMLATVRIRNLINSTQARQAYLLCRGPKFNLTEARLVYNLYETLQTIYTGAEICIPAPKEIAIDNIKEVEFAILNYITNVKENYETDDFVSIAAKLASTNENRAGFCLNGEDDFEKVMELSKNEAVLKWTWLAWREKVGPPMKEPYRRLIDVENAGARKNGYQDIGAAWRDELETPHLRELCQTLYKEIKPLYTLLHGVVRFYLRKHYGAIVPERGPIPAHLLGNLWSQNWEPLTKLIVPNAIDLDKNIKKLNWTVLHMAKRAEDFYQSFGLPAMTDTFWRESVLKRGNKDTRCHGTAADMFKENDFRLLYCSGTTIEDFYVLHHEMGHIQYYMAYEKQPALFRQANAAFHESVGDAVMYGVMTPQHLHRLGLINDSLLYSMDENQDDIEKITIEIYKGLRNNIYKGLPEFMVSNNPKVYTEFNNKDSYEDKVFRNTEIFLLKQALSKIPQIPFSLLIDEYRWKYFEGGISSGDTTKMFWQMALELQGIAPTTERVEEYFDVGAKFHVPDNTPYIRYFLSSFLQHQLFEKLCKAAVFGRKDTHHDLPDSIALNKCDIYGSKAAGKLLKDLMSRGHSQHWREILQQATGDNDISSAPLKRYYRPLYNLLMKLVRKHNIPLGWSDDDRTL